MSNFVRRYELDESRPTVRQARGDFLRRSALPGLAMLLLVIATGLVIVGPLEALPGEVALNQALVEQRTPAMNAVTAIWSNIGATLFLSASCVVAMVVLWRRTKQWWLAIVPGLALSLQASIFMLSALVVGRGRPDVEHLDVSPPTSGFPSGHTGASTAVYVTLALLSQRIVHPALRWAATLVCLLVPVLVGYARMYRGMHHLSDVVVGAINGLVCALLAWRYLRRDESATAEPDRATASTTA